jgi:2',3'-cyclic-nucleotide 2'-phosphodiesterase (5'-nucleotidase family)
LLGGLARQATFIEELRRARKGVILVDTGDLFYSRPPAQTPNAPKMGDLKADLYMKAYNLMGYDAFTPGELDFSFGLSPIVKMSKQANFPFLAANLVDTKSGKPVFKAYMIKEVQGVKIGLLGLISNRYLLGGPPEEKEKFHLADPIETAKKLVPGLRKRCQVIAVLGHMEADEQEMLAKAAPEIFFILSGHVPDYQLNPVRANNSQIFNAGSRGEHLVVIHLYCCKRRRKCTVQVLHYQRVRPALFQCRQHRRVHGGRHNVQPVAAERDRGLGGRVADPKLEGAPLFAFAAKGAKTIRRSFSGEDRCRRG